MTLTWLDELDHMLREAAGDYGIFICLVALRRTENGREGREFGVLNVHAPTYQMQCHVAANSIRHRLLRDPIRNSDGTLTAIWLANFSHVWAPPKAPNDPTDLNANHARNLIYWYNHYAAEVLTALHNLHGQGTDTTPGGTAPWTPKPSVPS